MHQPAAAAVRAPTFKPASAPIGPATIPPTNPPTIAPPMGKKYDLVRLIPCNCTSALCT